jgi:hypothetical protein
VDKTFSFRGRISFLVNNYTQIWKLKGKLEIHKFREHFHYVFLSSSELREKYIGISTAYYVQWGMYCFKKAAVEIDLEDKIKGCELIVGVWELEEFVENFADSNDYGEKPNWEILLIHLKNYEDDPSPKTVIVFKLDHGLGDGYTFVHMVEKLTGIKSPYLVKDKHFSFHDKVSMQNLVWKYPS